MNRRSFFVAYRVFLLSDNVLFVLSEKVRLMVEAVSRLFGYLGSPAIAAKSHRVCWLRALTGSHTQL